MQLDLKKIPFSRRLSRHMLYEETDNLGGGWTKGLYLALAAESGGSFIGGPMMGPKGFALLTPTSGGKDLGYTYTASPSAVTLKTDKGTVRFALDGTKVLRVEGSGVGLRLDGRLGFGSICIATARGVELTLAGGVYLIAARKGTLRLDCHWDLKALRSTDPILTVEPDAAGLIDLALYDTDDAYELPVLTEDFEACIAASEADYSAFTAALVQPAAGNDTFYGFCAYAIWSGFQTFKGKELSPSNKMSDQNYYAVEQPIITLALTDINRALDIIGDTLSFATPQGLLPAWFAERQNLSEAVPPLYAAAVSHLIENGSIHNVPTEKLAVFYEAMSKTVSWWLTKRTNDNGLSYYAYRHECNWLKEPIFGAGAPAATPDLAALLTLAAESLSEIAAMLNKPAEAASWGDVSRKQLDNLTQTLWDGTRLTSLNTQTGATAPAAGMLSLLPLFLGKRLPENMLNPLAEKAKALRYEDLAIIPATLIILGLKSSGKDAEAKEAAAKLIKSCIDCGTNDARGKLKASAGTFFSPAACAALLTLGGLQ